MNPLSTWALLEGVHGLCDAGLELLQVQKLKPSSSSRAENIKDTHAKAWLVNYSAKMGINNLGNVPKNTAALGSVCSQLMLHMQGNEMCSGRSKSFLELHEHNDQSSGGMHKYQMDQTIQTRVLKNLEDYIWQSGIM